MPTRKKKQTPTRITPEAKKRSPRPKVDGSQKELPANCRKACELARDGEYEQAKGVDAQLQRSSSGTKSARLRALIQNDLAVISAREDRLAETCADSYRLAISIQLSQRCVVLRRCLVLNCHQSFPDLCMFRTGHQRARRDDGIGLRKFGERT
jgi:hypothetical protein